MEVNRPVYIAKEGASFEKAQLIFLDAIERQEEKTVQKIEELLTEIKKRKKWRMKINRNFDTKLIQDVIIEQVEE
jgi:hypothetical protein